MDQLKRTRLIDAFWAERKLAKKHSLERQELFSKMTLTQFLVLEAIDTVVLTLRFVVIFGLVTLAFNIKKWIN